MSLLLRARRSRSSIATVVAPPVGGVFKVAANVGGVSDYAFEPTFVDLMLAFRGFGRWDDPYKSGIVPVLLDASDRYPAEDFGVTVPQVPLNAAVQTLKCKLGGAATITLQAAAGFSIANQTVVGDDTTFDFVIAAGNTPTNGCQMIFRNTKRTAASATNTGCRSLVMKSPGYSIADSTVVMPRAVSALSRFSSLRMMDNNAVNSDTVTITVGDRPADNRRGARSDANGLSLEVACRMCNQINTNLWWNVYAAASDALITEMATVIKTLLNPGLTVKFELSNENWNTMFRQHDYWMDIAMASVNGFSFQYTQSTTPLTYSRASNVITARNRYPHGAVPGDRIYVQDVYSGQVAQIVTVIATPDSKTLTWSDAGVDVALTVASGVIRCGRVIISASRLANVLTVETGIDHGIASGTSVGINGLGGLQGMNTVKATPTPRTMTFDDVGSDGPQGLGGGSSLVATFTNPLNSDGKWDQFALARRAYAKRTCEMSTLVKAVFGAEFGTRAFIGLMNQPGEDQRDQVGYIARVLGTPNAFLHAIGKATYFFTDASMFGGANLRNVTTFAGNTPPSHADYNAVLALTANGAKDYIKDKYDATAGCARTYGLRMWQYEFGPDLTGAPANIAGPAVGLSKIDTLFDPTFKASYRLLLDNMEAHGFEEVACYSAGPTKVGENNEYACWGIFRDFGDTTSPRVQAIDECMAATRTGPMRNMLNGASGAVTVIDGRGCSGIYNLTGAYPDLYAGRTSIGLDYIVTAPADGVYSFVPTFQCLTITTETVLFVNGAQVGGVYPLTANPAPIVPAARSITLTKGINAIHFDMGTKWLGSAAQMISLSFTAPP